MKTKMNIFFPNETSLSTVCSHFNILLVIFLDGLLRYGIPMEEMVSQIQGSSFLSTILAWCLVGTMMSQKPFEFY